MTSNKLWAGILALNLIVIMGNAVLYKIGVTNPYTKDNDLLTNFNIIITFVVTACIIYELFKGAKAKDESQR